MTGVARSKLTSRFLETWYYLSVRDWLRCAFTSLYSSLPNSGCMIAAFIKPLEIDQADSLAAS
jgi:hypothetical protein